MKDPQRIPEIIDQLQKLWALNPDLRLLQLLINAVNPCADLYHLEDAVLLARLKAALTSPENQLDCEDTDFCQSVDEKRP